MGFLDKLFGGKKDKVTPGGSPIYRYDTPEEQELRTPRKSGIYAKEVEAHFEVFFPGRESRVLHEIVSDLIHVDVHVMWPTPEQDFFVVYTTGMSDLPMTPDLSIPEEDRKNLELAELFLFLPGNWPLSKEGMPPEEAYWPIRMMKFMAHFPHQYHTWLGWGHTMPNGPDYAPLDDSVSFGGVVFSGGSGRLGRLDTEDGHRLSLLHLIPAYKEEIEYKLKYGMGELMKLFEEKDVDAVLNPKRPNLCANFKEVLDS